MTANKRILVLNGPNLNMLGTRQPEIYGDTKLQDIEAACQALASKLHMVAECAHSNHEGELVSLIQQASGNHDGIILNAGGYSHTSVAIRDALAMFSGKTIEVHISNIYNREEFRHISMLSAVSDGVIVGLGGNSYTLAIRALAELIYDE